MEKLLLGLEALDFLEKEGFPVLRSAFAADADQAGKAASDLGYPVALKIASPDAIHKTDVGGVKVGLACEEEVRGAFGAIMADFALANPGKGADGVLVQRMGGGLELIVGTLHDEQFGPVVMVGMGGIFAEAMKDVSFRLIPINADDARMMIEDLRGYRVLANPRGDRIDLTALEHLLVKVSHMIEAHPEVREMDLNPVFLSSRGIEICDARLKIRRPQ